MSYPNDQEHIHLVVSSGVGVIPWPRLLWFSEALSWHGGVVGLVVGLVDPDRVRRDGRPALPEIAPSVMLPAYDTEDWKDPEGPKAEGVSSILASTGGIFKEKIVLCCCHGGISRSTALAIAVLVQRRMMNSGLVSDEEIREVIEAVRKQRPPMSPNRLILSHAGSVLGIGDRLVAAVENDEMLLKRYEREGRGRWTGVYRGRSLGKRK